MASGGQSLEQGSDIVYQFCCCRCVKAGRNSEAVQFCEDCFDYLCEACLITHNSWVAMRSHKILSMDVIRGKSDTPPTFVKKICEVHKGSIVEMYCTEHDAVLCAECCEISDHRSCSLLYLPKAARGTKCSEELRQVKRKTTNLKVFCEKIGHRRQKDIVRVKEQNQRAKKRLDVVKNGFLISLNKSVDTVKEKIDKKTESHIDSINKDLIITQTVHHKLIQHDALLNHVDENEMQLFLQIHETKSVFNEYDVAVKEVDQNIGKEALVVRFDSPIKPFLEQEDSIITLIDEQHQLYSDGDMYPSDIRGLCQLKDGRIFAADHQNNKLKLLDSHIAYTVSDSVTVPSSPWDVCQVEDDLVAVTCGCRIQFVNVKCKLTPKNKFYVQDICRGITFCGAKLFVCCGGIDLGEGPSRILVFDKNGTELQEVNNKDRIGRPLSLAKSEDEKLIYVVDNHKGVVVLNTNAGLVDIATHPGLKGPTGISVGKGGTVYICSKDPGALFELKPKSKPVKIEKMKIVLGCKFALLFDRTYDRLIAQTSIRSKLEYVSI